MPSSAQLSNRIPEPVAPIAELMSTYPAPWAFCGGWAVDAWLGGQTREHGDVDVCVFIGDQHLVFEHLHDWQTTAHGQNVPLDTHQLWDGSGLVMNDHIHARLDLGEPLPERGDLTPEQGFTLDVQLGDREGDDWIFSRDPLISRPIQDVVQQSRWGLPTVVAEVLLFYKALDMRRRDRLDFHALLPNLTPGQCDWLRTALSTVGHPWLTHLPG